MKHQPHLMAINYNFRFSFRFFLFISIFDFHFIFLPIWFSVVVVYWDFDSVFYHSKEKKEIISRKKSRKIHLMMMVGSICIEQNKKNSLTTFIFHIKSSSYQWTIHSTISLCIILLLLFFPKERIIIILLNKISHFSNSFSFLDDQNHYLLPNNTHRDTETNITIINKYLIFIIIFFRFFVFGFLVCWGWWSLCVHFIFFSFSFVARASVVKLLIKPPPLSSMEDFLFSRFYLVTGWMNGKRYGWSEWNEKFTCHFLSWM